MHRFTNKRVPLSLAGGALLVAAGVIAASPVAQAQPRIDAAAICGAQDADEALAFMTTANGLAGYTPIIGSNDAAVEETLKGSSKNEVIWGFAGDDELKGGGGNDILCGGDGADRLKGGSGTNHLVGGPGVDIVKGGGGTDYVYADADDDPPAKPAGGVNFLCPTGAPVDDQCVQPAP